VRFAIRIIIGDSLLSSNNLGRIAACGELTSVSAAQFIEHPLMAVNGTKDPEIELQRIAALRRVGAKTQSIIL
jgi:hypothetical protein